MKVSAFDFELPTERIAQHPVRPRDAARMMHVGQEFGDAVFNDLPRFLASGDLVVFNDTRVIPARLRGRRGEAKIELTLHQQAGTGIWRAFARPARRLRVDDQIIFADDFAARVLGKGEGGEVTLQFTESGDRLRVALETHGQMPLPPYIRRDGDGERSDKDDYQTMFAANDGAVAAPTAGLHFTPEVVDALAAKGVKSVTVTLHVGAGTFLPVKAEDTEDHRMHDEWGQIDASTAAEINATRAAGGRIVAVGTTALRLLESAADSAGNVQAYTDRTSIFITPGYEFRVCDLLLTNFHLPKSTLFMLVCAFAGMDRMKDAYRNAIEREYRFYSYGDCCLLEREAAS